LQKRATRLTDNITSTTTYNQNLKKKFNIMTVSRACAHVRACEILLYSKMYLSTFRTNPMCHSYDTRN